MKVLYIIDDYPTPSRPYGATFPNYILGELSKKISVYPVFAKGRFSRTFFITFFDSLIGMIKFNPDIIQGITGNTGGLIASILGFFTGKKVVTFVRGSDVLIFPELNWLFKILIKFVLKNSDGVIVVATSLKDRVIELGAKKKKVHVVYPGTELDDYNIKLSKSALRRRLKLPEKSKIFIYIGNLIKNKHVDDVLYAFSTLKRADWTFIILGTGAEEEKLKAIAHNLGVSDRVIFCGPKKHDEIPYYLKASDVFISASASEGTPNVMFESLAAGLPIIFTKVGEVPRILDRNNAFLVTPKDRKELSIYIVKMLSDGNLRNKMGGNNKKLANQFDIKNSINKVLDIYKHVLKHE